MRSRGLAVLLLLLAAACADAIGPIPPGGEPFMPPARYTSLWKQIQDCSGFRGDFTTVTWIIYRGVDHIPGTRFTVGRTVFESRTVLLTEVAADTDGDVRHEMLHVLAGPTSATHPPEIHAPCGRSLIPEWGSIG